MGSGHTPGELLTPLVLNSILNKALQYSLHGDTPLASNFTFALRFLPETFHPHAPDSLNCLELRYKVKCFIEVLWCQCTPGCAFPRVIGNFNVTTCHALTNCSRCGILAYQALQWVNLLDWLEPARCNDTQWLMLHITPLALVALPCSSLFDFFCTAK